MDLMYFGQDFLNINFITIKIKYQQLGFGVG